MPRGNARRLISDCQRLRQGDQRNVVRSGHRNNFNDLQFGVVHLFRSRRLELRLCPAVAHALFFPLFTVEDPHMGVLSTTLRIHRSCHPIFQGSCQTPSQASPYFSIICTDGPGGVFWRLSSTGLSDVRRNGQLLPADELRAGGTRFRDAKSCLSLRASFPRTSSATLAVETRRPIRKADRLAVAPESRLCTRRETSSHLCHPSRRRNTELERHGCSARRRWQRALCPPPLRAASEHRARGSFPARRTRARRPRQ